MRAIRSFNKNWLMTAIDTETNKKQNDISVDLPFSCGADAFSAMVFSSNLTVTDTMSGETVYIRFEQISGHVKVFNNKELIGERTGKLSAFQLKITDAAVTGEKFKLTVAVEPAAMPDGNFTFGNVSIITTNKSHFDLEGPSCSGIRADILLTENAAKLQIHTTVANPTNYDFVSYAVEDEDGEIIALKTTKPTEADTEIEIPSPELWGGRYDATMYTLKAALVRDTTVLDDTEIPIGLKTLEIADDRFFRLNGIILSLNGIALADCDHPRTDRVLLDMIDANTVTMNMLPSKTDIINEFDRSGMLMWFDLPYDNSKSGFDDLKSFLLQNRVHPSFAFICCSEEADAEYIKNFKEICASCAPDIFTAIRCSIKNTESLPDELPDIVALTVTGENKDDNFTAIKSRINEIKTKHPDTRIVIIANAPYNTENKNGQPVAMSEPDLGEWHEKLLNTAYRDSAVIGFFAGTLTDNERDRQMGLVTANREYIRDVFWFYKAQFSAEEFVKICAAGLSETDKKKIDIKCYTSAIPSSIKPDGARVKLTVLGDKPKEYIAEERYAGVYMFKKVKLKNGTNTVVLEYKGATDTAEIKFEKK